MFAGVNPLYFIVGMATLGLAPFFLMMITSYVKIIVVTSLVRNALGVQQIPPTMVMDMKGILDKKTIPSDVQPAQMIDIISDLSVPLQEFLVKNTDPAITKTFVQTAQKIWPQDKQNFISDTNFLILIPAFTISELTKAFQIGFLLYLPFIVIDLIISNILLAMGMMMVSPMTISLPFKLLLFVTLDGWLKISQGLLLSYR